MKLSIVMALVLSIGLPAFAKLNEADLNVARVELGESLPQTPRWLCELSDKFMVSIPNMELQELASLGEVKKFSIAPMYRGLAVKNPILSEDFPLFGVKADFSKSSATEYGMLWVALPSEQSTLVIRVERKYAIQRGEGIQYQPAKNEAGGVSFTTTVKGVEIPNTESNVLSAALEAFAKMPEDHKCIEF